MPRRRKFDPPKPVRHKRSGRWFIKSRRLFGDDSQRYLTGQPGDLEFQKELAEYQQQFFRLLAGDEPAPPPPKAVAGTIVNMLDKYLEYAKRRYDRTYVLHCSRIVDMLEPYIAERVEDFGPLKARAVRESMVKAGWSRNYINGQMSRLRRIFGWAVGHELCSPQVAGALAYVEPLRIGQARETEDVQPVPQADVDAILPYLQPLPRAMVEFQQISGCRPGEMCDLQYNDLAILDDKVWAWTIKRHKTTWQGKKAKVIFLGPRAQAILSPYWSCDTRAKELRGECEFVFSPWRTQVEMGRKQINRRNRPCYDTASYRQAIHRAIEKCNREREEADEVAVPKWSPHQLRHARGTEIRERYGLEGAQIILGHDSISTTEIYAEKNARLARQIALECG